MTAQHVRVLGSRGTVISITPKPGDGYSVAFRLRRRAGPRFIEEVQNYTIYPGDDGWRTVDELWIASLRGDA